MSYSVDLRERVVGYVRGGGSPTIAAELFQVGRTTLYRWLGSADLRPQPAKERRRKLDKVALAAHVRDFPDALLRERAAYFGVTINAIWIALKRLAITKKTTRYSENCYEIRITFLRQLRAWVAGMLAEHGHRRLPVPRYSPDFNPIEKAFAILKRQRIFSKKTVEELIERGVSVSAWHRQRG
jgi:transposase